MPIEAANGFDLFVSVFLFFFVENKTPIRRPSEEDPVNVTTRNAPAGLALGPPILLY